MFSYTPSTQSQSDRRRTASSNVIGPTSYEAISWSIRESMSLSNGKGLSGSFTASANAIMALLRPTVVLFCLTVMSTNAWYRNVAARTINTRMPNVAAIVFLP